MIWFLITVAIVGHGFLWVAIVNRLHACPVVRWLLEAVTRISLLLFVTLPAMILWKHFDQPESLFQPLTSQATWATYYCCFCVLVCVLSLFAKVFEERNRYDSSIVVQSSSQHKDLAQGLGDEPYLTSFAKQLAKVPGNQTMQLGVVEHRLALPELPTALEGLKIVHLSDIHMAGRLCRQYYEQLVDVVNEQQPDVIALTGDIVEKTECWPWLETTLALMQARLGRYFILGNHDLFLDEAETVKKLREFGWNYVGDQWEQTVWNEVPVSIGGNELHWKGPPVSVPPKQTDELRIVLSHTPDQFNWCVRVEADLALAGHTHGGQFCFPVLGPILSPSLHGTRYCCGVFRRASTVLHVTRGFSGKTPLRLNCPPEVAVLTLKVG